jgi:hypothetical protein
MVERSASRFLAQGHLDGWRVREIDVQPAIAIVIPQNDTAAHRLDNVCAQRIGDMSETDACLLRDVFELRYLASFALNLLGIRRRRRRGRMLLLTQSHRCKQHRCADEQGANAK